MKTIFKNCNLILALLLATLYSSITWSYQLVYIHHISSTKKTFVVRIGKQNGIAEGLEASFTTPYLSLVARAESVTREFSTWKVLEPNGTIPFEKDMLVTYHASPERIWTDNPDLYFYLLSQKNKKLHSEEDGLDMPAFLYEQDILNMKRLLKNSFTVKGFFSNGVSQSTSFINSSKITSRTSNQFEMIYHKRFFDQFYLGLGFRHDIQTVDSYTVIVKSTRNYALFDINYHLSNFRDIYSHLFYVGASIGYGQVQTGVAHENLTGSTTIFPGLRFGLEFLLPQRFVFQLETSGESISIKEVFSDGDEQTTNEVNAKIGIGLKKYF